MSCLWLNCRLNWGGGGGGGGLLPSKRVVFGMSLGRKK